MNKRDIAILKDLERFRVMSRDHLAGLYFSQNKDPFITASAVLKRLVRDGYIKSHTNFKPYVYSLVDDPIKTNSRKIMHYLGIVDCYLSFKDEYEINDFQVEIKHHLSTISN